jgi:hypothetical protein
MIGRGLSYISMQIPTIKLKDLLLELALIEGLEKTCEINSAITNLNRMWTLGHNIEYDKIDGSIRMYIGEKIGVDELESIIRHINNFLGYFPAHISTKRRSVGYSYIEASKLIGGEFAIYFDAKYNQEPSQNDIPNTLYHISPSKHDKKILKIGLCPRHKDKMSAHPDRIYLALSLKAAAGLLTNPPFLIDKDGNKINNFTIYKIDVLRLKNDQNMKFYRDMMYANNGIYTHDNIPPQYLTIVKHIDISK